MLIKRQLEIASNCSTNDCNANECELRGLTHCMEETAQTALTLLDENEQLKQGIEKRDKALELVRDTFKTLDHLGGLGYEKHKWIKEALSAIEALGGNE